MSDHFNGKVRARVTFESWVMPSHEPGIQMVQVGGSWFAFDATAPGVTVEWLGEEAIPEYEVTSYDRVVSVQKHRHSEPVCADPVCETYLTPEQMDKEACAKCGHPFETCCEVRR